MRKTLCAGAGIGLVSLLTVFTAAAQEVATLVLRDGQRPSGELVDLNAGGFFLRINGQDRAFSTTDVVAIEFAGGGPSSEAQSRIAAGQSFMILRSGQIVDGRLTDIGGTRPLRITVETPSGMRDFTSNDVAQIYLYGPSRTATKDVAGSGLQAGSAGTIAVPANQPWTSTGIKVKKGDRLWFEATGHIMIAANASSGVGGSPAVTYPGVRYPVPEAPAGALIGRLDKRAPFAIGANTQPIVMTANGQLYLGVNDDNVADNTGAFTVAVRR